MRLKCVLACIYWCSLAIRSPKMHFITKSKQDLDPETKTVNNISYAVAVFKTQAGNSLGSRNYTDIPHVENITVLQHHMTLKPNHFSEKRGI